MTSASQPMRAVLKLALICAVILPLATARESHLVPPPSSFDRKGEWKDYMDAIHRAFVEKLPPFRVRCIVMPSFSPEWMIAVLPDTPTEAPRVLLVEAHHPLIVLLRSESDASRFDPAPFLTQRPERAISSEVSDQIVKAWARALEGVRIPEATSLVLLDGEEYVFTGRARLTLADGQRNPAPPFFSGSTRSTRGGTAAGQMVVLAGLLRQYVLEENEPQRVSDEILRVCAAILQVESPEKR